jgi:hypothetical protein
MPPTINFSTTSIPLESPLMFFALLGFLSFSILIILFLISLWRMAAAQREMLTHFKWMEKSQEKTADHLKEIAQSLHGMKASYQDQIQQAQKAASTTPPPSQQA